MILPQPYSVAVANWAEQHAHLSQVRFQVFVAEQKVPAELEMDALDATAVHAVARDASGATIGTGRLLLQPPIPRIGRMAVLKGWRNAGIGGAILKLLCDEAKARGFSEVMLHSQTHAAPFYFKHGFLSTGAEFTEAGIPHQEMRKRV
jgi:predicted GNAT family N-acyltransferase